MNSPVSIQYSWKTSPWGILQRERIITLFSVNFWVYKQRSNKSDLNLKIRSRLNLINLKVTARFIKIEHNYSLIWIPQRHLQKLLRLCQITAGWFDLQSRKEFDEHRSKYYRSYLKSGSSQQDARIAGCSLFYVFKMRAFQLPILDNLDFLSRIFSQKKRTNCW